MRSKVLVPLDGMPLAEAALPLARMLAQITGADIDLLRIVPADAPSTIDERARAYLNKIAAELTGDGQEVTTRVMRGDAGECIVREAAAQHVALVVMTTHARSGLPRAVLGSVSEYVVANAPAPTVLLRAGVHRPPRLKTMLLAIDGVCGAPLHNTMELARASAAHVVLLRVVTPDETYVWQWQGGAVLEEPQAVVSARQELDDLAVAMQAEGVSVDGRVAIGHVVPTIDSVANAVDADLIVMATHAKCGTQRALNGSVADAVVRTAAQPVLLTRLVPPPPRLYRDNDAS
jgi:nucleotide-binding universal stress UspA family protein